MNIEKLWKEGQWKKTPEFAAAASALVYGFLVHLFALTNLIHNHDNIASQPGGYGMGVALGRWFLPIFFLNHFVIWFIIPPKFYAILRHL